MSDKGFHEFVLSMLPYKRLETYFWGFRVHETWSRWLVEISVDLKAIFEPRVGSIEKGELEEVGFESTAQSSSSVVVCRHPCRAQKAHPESTEVHRCTLSPAGSAVKKIFSCQPITAMIAHLFLGIHIDDRAACCLKDLPLALKQLKLLLPMQFLIRMGRFLPVMGHSLWCTSDRGLACSPPLWFCR